MGIRQGVLGAGNLKDKIVGQGALRLANVMGKITGWDAGVAAI